MTQRELWLAASALMEHYGDDVGSYVVSRINDAIEYERQGEAQWWISLIPKINVLIGLDEYILH